MVDIREKLNALSPQKKALLLRRLQQQRDESQGRPPVRPANRDGRLPLSYEQERLWFLHQLMPNDAAYTIASAFRLTGTLTIDGIVEALNRIVERHEALRTTFYNVDGTPYQRILADEGVTLPVVDLEALPHAVGLQEARRLARREAHRSFDLETGPLMRALIIRLADDDYVLVLTMHHIISDGWSMRLLFREIAALSAARQMGQRAQLPDLSVQYADYALWQRRWLQGDVLEKKLNYWRNHLADAPPLALPIDHHRPAVQTYRGDREVIELPATLRNQLHDLAQEADATLFITLLAGFTALLHRYSHQDDIVVGTPVAGRHSTELEHLIGFFVNTLALRFDLSGDPSVREHLERVRAVALQGYEHQDVPFEKVVEALGVERDLSRSPLFQVLFQLQTVSDGEQVLPGLRVRTMDINQGAAQFDLTLAMVDDGKRLRATAIYSTDLFEAETIRRLLDNFRVLLEAFVTDRDQLISHLPLLSERECRLLSAWNDTDQPSPTDKLLHEAVAAQVVRTPDAVAVRADDDCITYAALERHATYVAHRLRTHGVRSGERVGLYVEPSVELVVGILGILKAGAAYVPLDANFPRKRVAYMLKDAEATAVVTQRHLVDAVPADNLATFVLDDAPGNTVGAPPPAVGPVPTSPAYVIYTSGSTGRPKGVMVPHRTVQNFLTAMRIRFPMSEDDVLLSVSTVSFDISVLDIFLPLTCGATVELVSRDVATNGYALAAHLSDSDATMMQATPATWRMLVDAGWHGNDDLRVLSGGEALLPPLAEALLARSAEVWNGYGPTEATIYASMWRVPQDPDVITIGRPIANTRFYVVDEQMQQVPIGVTGELLIGGAGVTHGYLNRPRKTAAAFIPDPFGSEPGGRLYRTGDLVRYRGDGTVEFLGRRDHQVKVRGYRIELGEIEAVLRGHKNVADGVVVLHEPTDDPADKQLVAYIVVAEEPAPTTDELRTCLRARLPAYMVPTVFVILDTLPLTPNNKVDRNALPAPDSDRRTACSRDHAEPRNALEKQLVAVWKEVLDVRSVSVTDDFFALGGNSLRAVRLVDLVRRRTGHRLPLRRVFERPTVRDMAAAIQEQTSWSGVLAHGIERAASDHHADIVEVTPDGKGAPLFFAAPLGGILPANAAAGPIDLGQRVTARPFYVLQPPPLAADALDCVLEARELDTIPEWRPPPDAITALAGDYVQTIRDIQPHGPYFLGGFSSGAVLAFEIAHQLDERGEDVGALVFIDSVAPSAVSENGADGGSLAGSDNAESLAWFITRDVPGAVERKMDYDAVVRELRERSPSERWEYALSQLRIHELVFPETGAEDVRRLYMLYRANLWALGSLLAQYDREPYPGNITVIVSSVTAGAISDVTLGWQAWSTEDVEVRTVSGDHRTIFLDGTVGDIVELIEQSLCEESAR